MKWVDEIDMKLSSPITANRLKKLLDDKRLVVVPSSARPTGAPRVVILDEVDSYPAAEHQQPTITTRG